MSARVYPLAALGGDPRFTHGLIIDVATVLEAAGYPAIRSVDFVDLQQALFRFIYAGSDVSAETLAAIRADQDAADRRHAAKVAEIDALLPDEDQPRVAARGHGQGERVRHAMYPDGTYAPRCGADNAVGNVALFVFAVTCPACLALLAEQARNDAHADIRAQLDDEQIGAHLVELGVYEDDDAEENR